MLIICNDISTQNPDVLKAIEGKDAKAIADIAQKAKSSGFNSLELYAGDAPDEAEALAFLIKAVEDFDLKLVIKAKDHSVFVPIVKASSTPQIIAPESITVDKAKELFQSLFDYDEGWQIMLTQNFGSTEFRKELDGFNALISAAEQAGIMPERIYLEPLVEPLIDAEHPFLKMRRLVNAFANIYPDIKFYVDLPLTASGLKDDTTLINVFIGMSDMLGVGAFSFSLKHEAHLKAVKAADALLNAQKSIKDFIDEI